MPDLIGNLSKMRVDIDDNNVAQYFLSLADQDVHMNTLIGQQVCIEFQSQINCVHCGRKTNKSFQQGYCFPCFRSLAQCDTCIIKPEQCHFAQGTCREPEWGEANCMQDHFVYLANTGAVKVGITRHVTDGVSSRWIDQGATQAMAIFRVATRKISGLVETTIAQHISDKTNWRTMLKGGYAAIDLVERWQALKPLVEDELKALIASEGLQSISEVEANPVQIEYPVLQHPEKIKSLNLDKVPVIEGQLLGIKGQYLLFDGDRVFNIRNAAGYYAQVSS
ncbi:DUF2797 domain-containing protein [Glaciecola sp. 1036]|uniref:DUF2797 domain-containing protein n=1 Tax=Alteromonadaceae TaxID=72275 RepID=UPI003D022534